MLLSQKRPIRLQFGLGTLFVLVAVACVVSAWLGSQLKWIHDRSAAFHWTDEQGAHHLIGIEGRPPPWGIRILGAAGFRQVLVVVADDEHLTDADRSAVHRAELLFPEADVSHSSGEIGFSLTPPEMIHGGGHGGGFY